MAKKKNTPLPDCASCEHEAVKKVCMDAEGLSSTGCPTLVYNDVLAEADKEYDRSESLSGNRAYSQLKSQNFIFSYQLHFHLKIVNFAKN